LVGQPHLTLQAARVEIEINTFARCSKSTREQRCSFESSVTDRSNEIFRPVIRHKRRRIRNRENQSFHAHAEPKTFCGRSVELFRQPIITAPTGNGILGTKPAGSDFESRSNVVIQSSDEFRIYTVTNAPGLEIRFEFLEVAAAAVAE